jgi:YgiT-type zinc finger domain-containing protein
MTGPEREERLVERLVRYTVEIDGRFIIVENVPARVDEETGERYFSPSTVERLQEIMWSEQAPDRVVETPVFEFAA